MFSIMNVDIEIYVLNLKKFFKDNPDQLKILIGEMDQVEFFSRLKDVSESNYKTKGEVELTKSQIAEVIATMFKEFVIQPDIENYLNRPIQRTKFGDIFLN
jgi:DNA primase large subunit